MNNSVQNVYRGVFSMICQYKSDSAMIWSRVIRTHNVIVAEALANPESALNLGALSELSHIETGS